MSEDKSQQADVQLTVRRIKEFSFSINEPLFAQKQAEASSETLQVEVGFQLFFTLETDLVFLQTSLQYHFPNAPSNETLCAISVQNVFEVSDLKRFQVGPSEIVLPQNIISALVGLSLSHTRAMMATHTSGTLLQENHLAVVDPAIVARHFFPNMFK